MLYRTVLARRVHRLKHEQQRPTVLGVEHLLLLREPLGASGAQLCGLALVQLKAARVSRVEVLQAKALTLGDAERVNVLLDAVKHLFFHRATSLCAETQFRQYRYEGRQERIVM
jgi:hypothetical protein